MTDRDLLERAAKAAGVDVHWGDGWQSDMLFKAIPRPNSPLVTNVRWDPLNDDGDALRLAVKLGIGVLFDLQDEKVTAYEQEPHGGYHVEYADDQDPAAATRRAIVRAAAAMAGD